MALKPSMSLGEYGRSRELPTVKVSRLAKPGGALADAVVRGPSGYVTGIDPWVADQLLMGAGIAFRAQPAPVIDLSPLGPLPAVGEVHTAADIETRKILTAIEEDAGDREEGDDLKAWQARHWRVKALTAEGKLVEKAEVVREWADTWSRVRNKMLALPATVKGAIPHLTVEEVVVITDLVRAALEDAAGDT